MKPFEIKLTKELTKELKKDFARADGSTSLTTRRLGFK